MDDSPGLTNLEARRKPVGLPDLPEDVFLLIVDNLEAWDFVRCRRVSRAWKRAFSEPEYLRIVLKKYPLAREVQHLSATRSLNRPTQGNDVDWDGVFCQIASRYFNLTHGQAHSITRHKVAVPEHARLPHWHAVSPWDYHESQPGGRLYYQSPLSPWESHSSRSGERAYLFRPSFWSYEDGLLIYAPVKQQEFRWDPRTNMTVPVHFALVLLDLESGKTFSVPFDLTKRVIRNFRLKDRTLVIEWAEQEPFHALNDSEKVHRHFASCYDVVLDVAPSGSDTTTREWTVPFRSEWKLHFLGLPLNSRDRFFSIHNETHYAIFIWQPNRSMYTGDEELPIESLFVWDIAHPSSYLPSLDPTGRNKPDVVTAKGPKVVSRFSFRDLDHLGIRQHSAISLLSLHLNSSASTIAFRENVCVAGQGYFDPAERLWCARTTTFPFLGHGPHLRREWEGNLPPYRGNGSMETVDVEEAEKWFLGIKDVVDEVANVRFSLVETVFTGQFVENRKLIRIQALGRLATLVDALADEVSHMGRIEGDERFLVGQNGSQEVVVLKF